ncbi:MAG: glycosyltransferase family 4 protein [Candidatus Cohnella colombiensis]|uniref:Glycosyltransferase family 4 protein n=1 Tax=Candidatus Cohnella colombiensis TaxID=3121368 RepID=A0AA95JGG7_9BACL|nr:MAG: glycosyltransferase family 4 protein [Cohnella sp.]
MKILASGMEWAEHRPGGLNHYFADYLKAMVEYGHVVEGHLSLEHKPHQAPSYIQDISAGSKKLGAIQRVRSFQASIKRRTPDFKPDVFNPHFGLYASMVTRKAIPNNVPIVTHFHGPWAQESLVEDRSGSLLKLLKYKCKHKIELETYHRSDGFIVLSDYFGELLAREYNISPERIHRVPGAADVTRFRPAENRVALREELGIREDQTLLFCARRLVRRMGIDRLIMAMSQVIAAHPNTILCIAGQGAMREELEQLIAQRQLQASVKLLGRVSDEALVKWYQAADLSIVPTITLEGFGLVTTESLACGTPVLGTPYGGTKEILEPLSPELLFKDGSSIAIASKLISVLRGDCQLPTREQCNSYVLERYTWKQASQSITAIFEQAIEQRKEVTQYESSLL